MNEGVCLWLDWTHDQDVLIDIGVAYFAGNYSAAPYGCTCDVKQDVIRCNMCASTLK